MLALDPARSSSGFDQLLRWMDVERQPACAVDPIFEAALEGDPGEATDDAEPFYAPYSQEMEMREFKRLVLDIGRDLQAIYTDNAWDAVDFQKYEKEIARIRRRYQG